MNTKSLGLNKIEYLFKIVSKIWGRMRGKNIT